jgi:hypothetical protein
VVEHYFHVDPGYKNYRLGTSTVRLFKEIVMSRKELMPGHGIGIPPPPHLLLLSVEDDGT